MTGGQTSEKLWVRKGLRDVPSCSGTPTRVVNAKGITGTICRKDGKKKKPR